MGKQVYTLIFGAIVACVLGYFGLDKIVKPIDPDQVASQGIPGIGSSDQPSNHGGSNSAGMVGNNQGYYSQTGYTNTGYGSNRANTQNRTQNYSGQNQQGNQAGNGNGSQVGFKQQIVVGTFNIQVFGESKMRDRNAMDVIVKVAKYFDVLAIQEVRTKDPTFANRFLQMLNADGSRYNYRIGKRQGRTNSKEQYLFIWNANTIDLIQENWFVPDPRDQFHREPMVATFRCRGPSPQNAFSFSLVNLHTDPHEAKEEMDAMADAFAFIQNTQSRQNYPEDDILLLGDLNLAPRQYGRIGRIPNLVAAIPDRIKTNTAGTRNYDNIIFDRYRTAEFTGKAGVFNLKGSPFFLNDIQAKKVSDHFPVWAVFSVYESRQTFANQSNSRAR